MKHIPVNQSRGPLGRLGNHTCAALMSVALFTVLSSAPASADPPPPRYTVTRLGDIPGRANTFPYRNVLNNRGQVVGFGFNVQFSDEIAFVWDGEMQLLPTFPGTVFSRAQGLNDRGQAVGEIAFNANNRRATLWEKGVIYDLGGLPDHVLNVALGINNRSQVVGASRKLDSAVFTPVLWYKGEVIALPLPPGTVGAFALHINDPGQIVGRTDPAASSRALLWDKSVVTDLGTLGGATARANAINNRGQIAGQAALVNGQSHAALWDHDGVLDLGTLGGTSSGANSLNNHGEVVGFARIAANVPHAFIWEDGVMIDLNDAIPADSGWELQSGEAINARGQISGFGLYSGALRAFLLTPVH